MSRWLSNLAKHIKPAPAPTPTPTPLPPPPAPAPPPTPIPAVPTPDYFIPHAYLSQWPMKAPLRITVVDQTLDTWQSAIQDAVAEVNAGPKGTMALVYRRGVPGSIEMSPGPYIYFLDWFCDPATVFFNAQGQPESPTNTLSGVLVGNGVYGQSVDPGNPIPYGVTGLNRYYLKPNVPGSLVGDSHGQHGLVMLELLNHFANEVSSFDYPNYIGPQGTHWPANPPMTWDDWGQLDASYPRSA